VNFAADKIPLGARAPPKMYIYCTSSGDGRTSCKVWLASGERRPCSNEAKTRNPLKLAEVPQTTGPISAASGPNSPYCGEIWRRYCCLTSIFPIVDACLSCDDIARQSCTMVLRWRIFGDFCDCIFSEPHAARFRPAS